MSVRIRYSHDSKKLVKAQARLLQEQAYSLRRENDEQDLDDLPWWRQRTLGNAITALISRYGP
jgi:hypothetical protein